MKFKFQAILSLMILISSCLNTSYGQSFTLLSQEEEQLTFIMNDVNADQIVSVKGLNGNEVPSLYFNMDTLILSELSSGNVYEINSIQDNEVRSNYFATKSRSSGEIRTYFNYELPQWPNSSLMPDGKTFGEVEKAIRDLIKSAQTSIDYCAYNTNVTSIVNELIDAKTRGVRVRVIVESDNANSAFSNSMPFPVMEDRNSNLMHNKFIVVDADDADNANVVNGSMNFTSGQMKSDPNHLMIIQDQSLARAYEMEFEEMWGSDDDNFNISNAKFGSDKKDNTPHEFIIGGIRSELYFSPSDKTSEKIIDALSTAQHHIDFGLLLFTYWDLRDKLKVKLNEGVRVRGIVEDESNSSSIVSELRSNGAEIHYHEASGIYHHKMGIIDGEFENSNPQLVSGSHNWTYSAETYNDENTMIFQDAGLTEMFKRAFSAHWNNLSTSNATEELDQITIGPNPFSNEVTIQGIQGDNTRFKIVNSNGITLIEGNLNENSAIDLHTLPSGVYFILLSQNALFLTKMLMKL